MLSTEQIDKIFRASTKEAKDKLAQLKQELESLIASELSVEVTSKDVNSVLIQELQTTVAQINNTITRINAENGNDSQTIKLKADEFYEIAKILKNISDRHQEFYSKNLLKGLRFNANWYEGFGKMCEIRYVIKNKENTSIKQNTSSLNFEYWLKFYNLLVDFLEKFSEIHPEEAIRMGEFATRVIELNQTLLPIDEWLALPKSAREALLAQLSQGQTSPISEELYINARKAEEKFIETALAALERIAGSRKGSSLLPYMTNLGRTREEQIQKNQKALALIQSWIDEEVSEEELEKSRETWERVKRIIDEQRPPGQKLFSEE